MNGLVRMMLGFANVPDALVNDLDKNSPEFLRLIETVKELEPILEKAAPLLEQATPILKKAYPDLVIILPTIHELVLFLNSKK